jgi:hypothetical protein
VAPSGEKDPNFCKFVQAAARRPKAEHGRGVGSPNCGRLGSQTCVVTKLPSDWCHGRSAFWCNLDRRGSHLARQASYSAGANPGHTQVIEPALPSAVLDALRKVASSVRADHVVMLLADGAGRPEPRALWKRTNEAAAYRLSATVVNRVVAERRAILSHDAAMDFAESGAKSMILHRLASIVVAPLVSDEKLFGMIWADSETLAQFQTRDVDTMVGIADELTQVLLELGAGVITLPFTGSFAEPIPTSAFAFQGVPPSGFAPPPPDSQPFGRTYPPADEFQPEPVNERPSYSTAAFTQKVELRLRSSFHYAPPRIPTSFGSATKPPRERCRTACSAPVGAPFWSRAFAAQARARSSTTPSSSPAPSPLKRSSG